MLPVFVIPECNITLEKVLRYIARYPAEGSINYEEAGIILGTYDNRTILKHILLAWHMIRKANLCLVRVLVSVTSYAVLPETPADEKSYEYLNHLVQEAEDASVRIRGQTAEKKPLGGYVHGACVFEKARKRLKTTLNYVFHTLLFFDTS